MGDKAGTDAAIDGAEVVVKQRIVNQRFIPNPMETRGDIGWYNPGPTSTPSGCRARRRTSSGCC